MAFPRAIRRRFRRRRFRRRGRRIFKRRRRFRFRRQPLQLEGVGNRKLVKLRYVDHIAINPTSGVATAHAFRANDMFDPNATGIGHQPLMFDEWMQIYDHFTVLGSKIKVEYLHDTTLSLIPGTFGVIVSDGGNTVSLQNNLNQLFEQKLHRGKRLQVGVTPMSVGNPMVVAKFSAKRFFGRKFLTGAAEYQGSASGGPNEQAFFEVYVAPPQGTDTASLQFRVTVDYIAMLTERKPILQQS